MPSFEGKCVIVTGAGSGIGRASALAFTQAGARVACLDRNLPAAHETIERIERAGGFGVVVPTDVTDPDSVQASVDRAVDRLGGLDIAHNNAGVLPPPAPVATLAVADWERAFAVNVTGVLHCMQAELRYLVARRNGVIVNTSSNIGRHGRRPGMAAYAASKAAVSTLTAAAALDHIADGVRINAVSPGATATTMSRRPGETDEDRDRRLAATVPIARAAEVDEIARAVLWAASDESSFMVGHDLVIDGGVTA